LRGSGCPLETSKGKKEEDTCGGHSKSLAGGYEELFPPLKGELRGLWGLAKESNKHKRVISERKKKVTG